jgi:DNA-directed RNA polymerase specialized sigma24 family protein
MPIKTDRDLVVAYVEAGDESSFSELAVRHTQMVHRTCFRMLGNIHDTQDATQAVFIGPVGSMCRRRPRRSERCGAVSGWG